MGTLLPAELSRRKVYRRWLTSSHLFTDAAFGWYGLRAIFEARLAAWAREQQLVLDLSTLDFRVLVERYPPRMPTPMPVVVAVFAYAEGTGQAWWEVSEAELLFRLQPFDDDQEGAA